MSVRSSVVVVVRRARPGDAAARCRVVQAAWNSLTFEAFLYFFLQETTLQVIVLCGAVLFIFLHAGLGTCCAVPLVAAVIAYVSASASHIYIASRQAQLIHVEEAGWVAEVRSPLLKPLAHTHVSVQQEDDYYNTHSDNVISYSQVVGSASLGACGDASGGWLRALAVAPDWQRRGIGTALVSAVRREARRAGEPELCAVVSHIQHGARAIFHKTGWECNFSYSRPLLGAAWSLPLSRLSVSLTPDA